MEEQIAQIAAKVESIEERLDKLERTVYIGNGHPSLLARVESIDTKVSAMSKLIWILVGGVASMLVKMWFG